MNVLNKINDFSDNISSIIFDHTNVIFPKQNFLIISKSRAFFMIVVPFVIGISTLAIFSLMDSWAVKFVSSILVSFAGLKHVLYFRKELKFLNTPMRKIAFRKSSGLCLCHF